MIALVLTLAPNNVAASCLGKRKREEFAASLPRLQTNFQRQYQIIQTTPPPSFLSELVEKYKNYTTPSPISTPQSQKSAQRRDNPTTPSSCAHTSLLSTPSIQPTSFSGSTNSRLSSPSPQAPSLPALLVGRQIQMSPRQPRKR